MILSNKRGFTLTEVMLVAVISGIVVVATGQLVMTLQGQLKKSQQSSNRVLSIYRLSDRVTDKSAFLKSLALTPENDKLRSCMLGGPLVGTACLSNCCTPSTTPVEFVLLDPTDTSNPLANRRKLLGTTAEPAFYTAEGETCASGSPGCFYKVTGNFLPRCPGGEATCDRADLMTINLLIEPATVTARVKTRELKLQFAPNINSKPTIAAIVNQSVQVGKTVKVPVLGSSGHTQERQDLIFNTCESSDKNIATVTCYGFMNEKAQVVVTGVTAGSVTVTLKIDDTSPQIDKITEPSAVPDNISDPGTFVVDVIP